MKNIKKTFMPGIFVLIFTVLSSCISGDRGRMKYSTTLWFDHSAKDFTQSLPLGNGRMGFMVFGGVDSDRIVLNEESMWSGSPFDNNLKDAYKKLPEIRRLLLAGKNYEAEKIVNKAFVCRGKGSNHGKAANAPFGCYQTLGNIYLNFQESDSVRDYHRSLDLRKAVVQVSYRSGGVKYDRIYFISAPDQVGVIRLTSDKKNAIHLRVGMDRPEHAETITVNGNELLMKGHLPDGQGGKKGVRYAARLRVFPLNGRVYAKGNSLEITDADDVLILFDAETDYHGNVPRDRKVVDPVAMTKEVIDAASAKKFKDLFADHIADYKKYFDRVSIILGDGSKESQINEKLPTDLRLVKFDHEDHDPALASLYFNYGRYLLISSSRPGTLPANLQGIWAEEIQTPWNGDWHLDINVQMNYWPAEVCNLGDCQKPLLKLIESLQKPGRETAKAYYNDDGWVAHVITNAWGFTAPGESASWGSTVSGSAWLCEHLWNHYAYGGDIKYLKWAYPIMKASARFYLGMLIEEPEHGWLVTAPSNSPENAFYDVHGHIVHTCMGPTIDMQILRELFANCISAATILDLDQSFREQLKKVRERLAPNQISPDGRIQEWLKPYKEVNVHHRHLSLLYGLYPYYEISPYKTPKLANAGRKTLVTRGDEGPGWSLAWKMNLWARLLDGDHAYKLFRNLLVPVDEAIVNMTNKNVANKGHTYYNLFDAHPIFQIDGNFGATAGIAEMLMQSHNGVIYLLPALPDAWPNGEVKGLCARGGFVVNMKWENSILKTATVLSKNGNHCKIRYKDKETEFDTRQEKVYKLTERMFVTKNLK